MKKESIKVGTKIGTELFQVECSVRIPETEKEMQELALHGRSFNDAGAECMEFVLQMFTRGWRIWNQEQSGARDTVREATVAEREAPTFKAVVQSVIDNADPLAPAKRTGRPAAPKSVVADDAIAKAMRSGDLSKLSELLAAQGVKINFTK